MSRLVGTQGEALVANYLRDRGYTIREASFYCRFGEIDLIAQKDKLLCFVEVKLRSNVSFGLPREAVDIKKQRKLLAAAEYYLSLQEEEWQVRFDVAEVYMDRNHCKKTARIEYIMAAFENQH